MKKGGRGEGGERKILKNESMNHFTRDRKPKQAPKSKEEKILLNKKKLRHVTHESIEPNLKFSRLGFDRQ